MCCSLSVFNDGVAKVTKYMNYRKGFPRMAHSRALKVFGILSPYITIILSSLEFVQRHRGIETACPCAMPISGKRSFWEWVKLHSLVVSVPTPFVSLVALCIGRLTTYSFINKLNVCKYPGARCGYICMGR